MRNGSGKIRKKKATMIASEREQLILDHLRQHKTITTEAIALLTGASLSTARRDLNTLGQKGLLEKKHGGAKVLQDATHGTGRAVDDDPHLAEKDRIAIVASSLVKGGDTIFLGAGKTCTLLARYIRDVDNLRVVTTNINSVIELAASDKASMLLLGGDIHVGKNYIETLDEYTLRSLEKYYFNKVFITVDGVDLEYGYSINYRLQVMLYEYLLENSKEFYMMAGNHKLDKRAFIRFCAMDRIRRVITIPDLNPIYMAYFRENMISVHT
jgi:DeoR/GlpR family transcriptional regulator of sugar metabolism